MNKQRAIEWIVNGEIGVSSKTMWSALMGVPYKRADFPHDGGDFRRCYLFAQTAELLPEDFERICQVYPWWRNIYEIWPDLSAALADMDGKKLYDLLQEPKRHARLMYQAKGLVEVSKGIWMSENSAKQRGINYTLPE